MTTLCPPKPNELTAAAQFAGSRRGASRITSISASDVDLAHVAGWRGTPDVQAVRGGRGGNRAGSAQGMAELGFQRAHRDGRQGRAEGSPQRRRLRRIPGAGGGGVRADVAHIRGLPRRRSAAPR